MRTLTPIQWPRQYHVRVAQHRAMALDHTVASHTALLYVVVELASLDEDFEQVGRCRVGRANSHDCRLGHRAVDRPRLSF